MVKHTLVRIGQCLRHTLKDSSKKGQCEGGLIFGVFVGE